MSVASARTDLPDGMVTDAENRGGFGAGATFPKSLSHGAHLVGGEQGDPALFHRHVEHVGAPGADRQMFWVYAFWVIASVHYVQMRGYFNIVCNFVRNPMREFLGGEASGADKSVPFVIGIRNPRPTIVIVKALELFVETFNKGAFPRHRYAYGQTVPRCQAVGG